MKTNRFGIFLVFSVLFLSATFFQAVTVSAHGFDETQSRDVDDSRQDDLDRTRDADEELRNDHSELHAYCGYFNEFHDASIDKRDLMHLDMQLREPFSPTTKSLISAKSSSFLAAVVTYPMDLMKIRKQTSTKARGHLYQGFPPFAAAFCFNTMLNLAIFDTLKNEGHDTFTSGVASGFVAGIFSNPIWTYRVKKSLAKAGHSYRVKDFAKEMKLDWRTGFRGQMVNVPHSISNGVFFLVVEQVNDKLKDYSDDSGEESEGNLLVRATASSSARVLVNSVVYPFDTLRIIRQKTGKSYTEIANGFVEESRSFGGSRPIAAMKPFYRGFCYATARTTVCTTIYMELHSEFKKRLGYYSDQD